MKVAIIGCGLIGNKRAKNLKDCSLLFCADKDFERAKALAAWNSGCLAVRDWCEILYKPEVEIIIIATTHDMLAEITLAAVRAGKHVLVEKPAARFSNELEPILKVMEGFSTLVRVGFNHRYHKAFRKAYALYQSGQLGELMFIRGRYGHGGRINYSKEWRADPRISGGGELIDQGMHLIDLSRWFLGEFTEVDGFAHTYYWDMPVDDNGFMLLKTATKKSAFLQASCTEWKNLFSFEIYGKKAKLEIQGLGGSYGLERLIYYKNLPEMGPPETEIWEFPMQDDSWEVEFKCFVEDIKKNRSSGPDLNDAYAALNIVKKIAQGSGYDYYP
ncbi:MAG: Gfo/Idh/MocA family oxidoreductase [Rickettsia endosymbiont of Ixodes persulcatus]|nr:Gfo/Idh/MocA family oxidoreductase [Rickettsia endosymbiont of Ixodes persulcatus]MCZ6914288.1 Gfo/Idh/MocA family oxidoreductase [Rickettsia endosymbiont of Ixodes persulcatus]